LLFIDSSTFKVKDNFVPEGKFCMGIVAELFHKINIMQDNKTRSKYRHRRKRDMIDRPIPWIKVQVLKC